MVVIMKKKDTKETILTKKDIVKMLLKNKREMYSLSLIF